MWALSTKDNSQLSVEADMDRCVYSVCLYLQYPMGAAMNEILSGSHSPTRTDRELSRHGWFPL